jgi:hypothetical protein
LSLKTENGGHGSELQKANEELLTMNEEVTGAVEELETTNRELISSQNEIERNYRELHDKETLIMKSLEEKEILLRNSTTVRRTIGRSSAAFFICNRPH